jgi:nicotinamide-nucleotide amidase
VTDDLARSVVSALRERDETVAAAESLTGGLLSAAFVDVPGASAVFRGGLVVYATDLKVSVAEVPADMLARCGPVDGEVAAALAKGAQHRCGADWGVSTTGVAGPEAVDDHAVGEVWIGISGPFGAASVRRDLDGDRATIRAGAVEAALRALAARLVP